jgi:DNA-binding GntR family transcriptional regulator
MVRRRKNMASKLSKLNFNDYKPLREVIFATLREAIVEGELEPGERLLEVKLAEKMGGKQNTSERSNTYA